MNKREKEVLQLPLDKEKAVLKKLEAEYRQALADVNMRIRLLQSDEMTVSRVYHLEYQKTIKKQVEAILEKLHSDEFSTIEQFLAESYVDGYVKTGYLLYDQGVPVITPIDQQAVVEAIQNETKLKESLYDELGYDVDKLKKTVTSEITRGIATGLQYVEIARNIANHTGVAMSRAKTIARNEAARVQEKATMDAAYKAKAKGADVLKEWSAILDGKTRPHHRELDGQIRELDEPFTVAGKKAMHPKDFDDAAEDMNCRCTSLIKSRRSLERSIRKRDNFTGELLEFETAKDYEEFKKRYFSDENVAFMKYAEKLEEKHHVERLDDLWDMMTKDERERFLELKNASPMWKTTAQNTDGRINLGQAKKITEKVGKRNAFSVDANLVNSKAYHDKFESLTQHKAANEAIYQEATRMLEHRDGTECEDMALLDYRTGAFITGNYESQKRGKTGLTDEQYKAFAKHSGDVVIVHNHPNGSRLSYTDIQTMYKHNNVVAVVAVGHDGSVHVATELNRKVDIEKVWEMLYNRSVEKYGDADLARIRATDALYRAGVFKYESR